MVERRDLAPVPDENFGFGLVRVFRRLFVVCRRRSVAVGLAASIPSSEPVGVD